MIPLLFALAAGLSDLIAGALALRGTTARIQSRYVIAFGAGVLLAATFFDVLPEVAVKADTPWLAAGFVAFYLLEKITMLHACGEDECETHHIGPSAVIGMALDNVVDGVSVSVGYLIDPFLGLVITLAVVLHEIPQGITSAVIMREANWSRARIVAVLGIAGALYPIGALLAGLIPESFLHPALAFIAGDFIYIGASDLLPEAHRRFNAAVIVSVLVGMAFVLALRAIFPAV
jgi:zinc and cadmium transporter